MTSASWSQRLEMAFNSKLPKGKGARRVRFPESRDDGRFLIYGESTHVTVQLGVQATMGNMQANSSCFEIWCLALHEICEISTVELAWKVPEHVSDPHYQRFLYRVRNFLSLFDWFCVANPHLLDTSRIQPGANLRLNAPAVRKGSDDLIASGEAALERACLKDPNFFDFFGCAEGLVGRQLPVGVFQDKVASSAMVLPGAKGAIDLYAIENGCFWLFELKAGDNIPPGALSEILFYTSLMRDLCRGIVQPTHEVGRMIAESREIRAWIVGHKIHPLLDSDLSSIPSALQYAIDSKWSLDGPRVTLQSVALQGEGASFSHPIQKVT